MALPGYLVKSSLTDDATHAAYGGMLRAMMGGGAVDPLIQGRIDSTLSSDSKLAAARGGSAAPQVANAMERYKAMAAAVQKRDNYARNMGDMSLAGGFQNAALGKYDLDTQLELQRKQLEEQRKQARRAKYGQMLAAVGSIFGSPIVGAAIAGASNAGDKDKD